MNMKMIVLIVANNDADTIQNQLCCNGYFATKVSSCGMFLKDGNTTFLIGTEDDQIESLIKIIEENVTPRKTKQYDIKSNANGSLLKNTISIDEYGAVIFSVPIDGYRKI